jgi:hypothetical protein
MAAIRAQESLDDDHRRAVSRGGRSRPADSTDVEKPAPLRRARGGRLGRRLFATLHDHVRVQGAPNLLRDELYGRVASGNLRASAKVEIRTHGQRVPRVGSLSRADEIDDSCKPKVQKAPRLLFAHALRNDRVRLFLCVLYTRQVRVHVGVDQSRREIEIFAVDDLDVRCTGYGRSAVADGHDTVVFDGTVTSRCGAGCSGEMTVT